jgi:hypothetical protein
VYFAFSALNSIASPSVIFFNNTRRLSFLASSVTFIRDAKSNMSPQ